MNTEAKELPWQSREIRRVVFEEHPDLERARRVAIFERAAARLGMQQESADYGLGAKRVVCESTGHEFESTFAAARWLTATSGRTVPRSQLRTALKRGLRCAGYKFRYVADAPRRIIANGMGKPVVVAGRTFTSIGEAARFAGVSSHAVRDALANGGAVKGMKFARPDPARTSRAA
jgi:hypothetical protein